MPCLDQTSKSVQDIHKSNNSKADLQYTNAIISMKKIIR